MVIPADETPPVVIEDLAEPITAWRVWRWDRSRNVSIWERKVKIEGKLVSTSGYVPWEREMEAVCLCPRLNSHHGIDRECLLVPGPANRPMMYGLGCGLYAVKKPEDLRRWTYCLANNANVVGTVQLGGRVYEHSWGYRAQHARITGIYVGTICPLCYTLYPHVDYDDEETIASTKLELCRLAHHLGVPYFTELENPPCPIDPLP